MAESDKKAIPGKYESNLKIAKAALASLEFCCSEEPSFQGLSGWVFEQTVQDCLRKQLNALGIRAEIQEQATLAGRARADLLIGSAVAIEIKAKGLFDKNAASRYCRYHSCPN